MIFVCAFVLCALSDSSVFFLRPNVRMAGFLFRRVRVCILMDGSAFQRLCGYALMAYFFLS